MKAANEQGEIALAEDASQTAMALNIASVILGSICITIFVIYKVQEIQELKKQHWRSLLWEEDMPQFYCLRSLFSIHL